MDEVEQKFPEVFPVLNQFRRARIGILVDNVDHGLTLSRRLAGWPVIASADMARDGLSSKDRFVLRQGRSAAAKSAKTVIVTSRCLHDAGALDIIVRADGGLGVPQVKLDSVRPFGSRRPRDVLIIDFDDRHHRMLRARFKQRRKSYLETGWKLLQDRQTDLERFMAQRPEVTWT